MSDDNRTCYACEHPARGRLTLITAGEYGYGPDELIGDDIRLCSVCMGTRAGDSIRVNGMRGIPHGTVDILVAISYAANEVIDAIERGQR